MGGPACPTAGSINWHDEIDRLVANVKPVRPEDIKHKKTEIGGINAKTWKYGRGDVKIWDHYTVESFLFNIWKREPVDKTLHRVVIPKLMYKAAVVYYIFNDKEGVTHLMRVDTEFVSCDYWGQIEAFVRKHMPFIAIDRHGGEHLLHLLFGIR